MSEIKENQYGTAQYQSLLLEMMKDIHAYCERYNIRYSLSGGSLLGAVRHQGFIPWDDDIDIMLDRKNYDKFVENFSDVAGYTLSRNLWILRVQRKGALDERTPTIDLFIVDNAPDNSLICKWKVLRLKILQGMMKKSAGRKVSLFYKICLICTHFFGKLFTYNYKWKQYHKISQVGNKKETKTVSVYNDLFKYISLRYDKNLMQKIVLHKFEDVEFYITEEFNHYLTIVYGDYMTPPEEKDRVPIHI